MAGLADKHSNPEINNLLLALANRHSSSNNLVPVNFRVFANLAYTKGREGEPRCLALGASGSEERKECRRLYDKYRKRKDLHVPSDYSYWSLLKKTDKLVIELNNPSPPSSSVSPPRRRLSHPNKNRTPPRNNTSQTSASIITPPTITMTSLSKPIPEVLSDAEFATLHATVEKYSNMSVLYFDERQNGKNQDAITWLEEKVKNSKDGKYYNYGHILIPLPGGAAMFLIANPRIGKGGRSIKWNEPKHDPIISTSVLTKQVYRALVRDKEAVLGRNLTDPEKAVVLKMVEDGLDMQIAALKKRSVGELEDLEIGGRILPSVPVREKEVLVEPGLHISNKFRNPNSQDNGLDKTLVLLNDISELKQTGVAKLQSIGELLPTQADLNAAMDEDAKIQLYGGMANAFGMANMDINTKFYMHLQVVLDGEEKDGTGGPGESLATALGNINLLG